jgi:large subunit ribosomal protein L3
MYQVGAGDNSMVNKLLGKKMGMTRYFLDEGKSVPVTVLSVGPCVVLQKKTRDKDGYDAIQVGFEPKRESRVNKPLVGHFQAAGKGCFAHLGEIRVDEVQEFELGQEITSDVFQVGDRVHVSAASKGRGFAGVMKRWAFSGGRKTHGSRSHRVPGSIGCSATPARVVKGKKMPGRMGTQRVTVKNLRVVDVRPEMGVVLVKGAVPGSRNSIVEIYRA